MQTKLSTSVKEISRYLILIYCVGAVISLFCPVYSASDQLDEAFVVTVKAMNLPEFSGWGGITVALPFLLAALVFSSWNAAVKTGYWFLLNLIGAYGVPAALLAARTALAEQIGPFITRLSGLSIFIPLLIAASVSALFTFTDINDCEKNENKV